MMSGKAQGRTRAGYMRGDFPGTDGGRIGAELWARVGQDLHPEAVWVVTERGGRWLALCGTEGEYAAAHPEARLAEIISSARQSGRIVVGVGIVPLLFVLLLAAPVLVGAALAVGAVLACGVILRVIIWVAEKLHKERKDETWST